MIARTKVFPIEQSILLLCVLFLAVFSLSEVVFILFKGFCMVLIYFVLRMGVILVLADSYNLLSFLTRITYVVKVAFCLLRIL